MFNPAKWFGLSLVLHLAVAIILVLSASRNIERTPKAVMVFLDNLVMVDIAPHKDSHTPLLTAAKPDASSRLPGPAKPEATRQLFQTVAPRIPPMIPITEQNRTKELSKTSPEVPVAADSIKRVEDSNPAPGSLVKTQVQHAAPAAGKRPAVEKVQQRYLKEHFTYIRELISTHLVYPPMARKMNWSGKVVVAFVVIEDGTVNSIRVIETSGFPVLDRSAVETVRSVAPFPKPLQQAEIVVPINFIMMQ